MSPDTTRPAFAPWDIRELPRIVTTEDSARRLRTFAAIEEQLGKALALGRQHQESAPMPPARTPSSRVALYLFHHAMPTPTAHPTTAPMRGRGRGAFVDLARTRTTPRDRVPHRRLSGAAASQDHRLHHFVAALGADAADVANDGGTRAQENTTHPRR